MQHEGSRKGFVNGYRKSNFSLAKQNTTKEDEVGDADEIPAPEEREAWYPPDGCGGTDEKGVAKEGGAEAAAAGILRFLSRVVC